MRIAIKQGDTRHAIRATLKTVDGVPIDLTDSQIVFKLHSRYGGTLINREATYETNGKVHFVFESGETDTPGLYEAEFQVIYLDGRVETFPHSGKLQIYIEARIGGLINGV